MNDRHLTGSIAAAITLLVAAIALLALTRTDFDTLADNLIFDCRPGSAYTVKECP